MKKLICAADIEALANKGEKIMYIDADTLITPSARDAAVENDIEFCDGPAPAACCESAAPAAPAATPAAPVAAAGGIDQEVIYQALKALMEKGMLDQVMNAVGSDVPYVAECSADGTLKHVKSSTAKWLPLLEEGPNVDKVFYNQLIGDNDASSMGAGFITIENCNFPWTTACQELYYVVEGTLEVKQGDKVYTANAGDCLFFENGIDLTFGSPNKMKAFYATH